MPSLLRFNADLPDATQLLVLDDRQFEVRLYWMSVLGAFYVDVKDDQGAVVVSGERLTPNAGIGKGVLDLPGEFIGYGPDPYTREDLAAGNLGVIFFSNSELDDAEAI